MKKAHSLRQRMIFRFVLAALIPVLIFAAVSIFRVRQSSESNLNDRVSSNLNNANKSLDMVLDKYATVLYELSTDEEILDIVEKINQDEDDLNVNSNMLRRNLSHICNRNSAIDGITILTKNGKVIFYDQLSASSTTSVWADTMQVPNVTRGVVYQGRVSPVNVNNRKTYMFQLARNLVDYRHIHNPLGTVVLSIDEQEIKKALSVGMEANAYLLNDEIVISAPKDNDIGRYFVQLQNKVVNRYTKIVNETSGFTICNEQPTEGYVRTMWEQLAFLIIVAIAAGVIMLLLIYSFTKPYLKAVDQFVGAMNDVEEGKLTTRIQVPESVAPEIRKIGVDFNEMMAHMELLIAQVKQAVIDQKNAELSALEAQIDPHFLYNTLDTINWKAIENEQYDISEMVGALADILRYTVKNAGGTATMRQELAWLEEYTMLQSVKLGKRLVIKKQVPESLMGYKIHKLLLQPFVENAIKYGYEENSGECRLTINMHLSGNQIHIKIEDNGCGIESDMLDKLNNESDELEGHVGVSNVRKRLKLYYGENATLYFESILGSYTKVHLFIPTGEEGICKS